LGSCGGVIGRVVIEDIDTPELVRTGSSAAKETGAANSRVLGITAGLENAGVVDDAKDREGELRKLSVRASSVRGSMRAVEWMSTASRTADVSARTIDKGVK
jgi:hypothetical protein